MNPVMARIEGEWHRVRGRLGCGGMLLAAAVLLTGSQTRAQASANLSAPAGAGFTGAPFSVAGAASPEQIVHIRVGRTFSLNARGRVTRIYIGNPAVLDSYTVSPKQVLLTAKAPGISSVVLWDDSNRSESYMVSADIDLADLRSSLAHALPNEAVAAQASEGRVVLTGTVSTRAAADAAVKLANLFSKDVVDSLVVNSAQAKQVELKVRYVEVDRTRLNQYGINIFGPGGGTAIGSSTTSQFPSTATLTQGSSGSSGSGSGSIVGGNTLTVSNPLNFLFYSSKLGVGVTLQDLESRDLAQTIAEPTITTLSGQTASFLAGGEFPFPVVQGSSGGPTSITIQFRPYGVKLDFTPMVNVDGTIDLKVTPEVSALDFTNAVTISGYTIPALSTKRANTQVVLRSGQSFAISGLLDKQTTDVLSHTPGFANIPILGALFKSKNVNLSTSELIVIVTPTIIDPLTHTSPPVEPAVNRPFLNPQKFDRGVPGKQ